MDTGAAAQELTTAAEYQRKAGRRAACLTLILAVVAAIVLLAVRTPFSPPYPNSDFVISDLILDYIPPLIPCIDEASF